MSAVPKTLRWCVPLLLTLLAWPAWARDAGAVQEEITLLPGKGTTVNDLAKHHYEEGLALLRQEKYRLARVEFQVAYDLCQAPELLHNISIVAERQYLLDDAIKYEELFLASKPTLTEEERRETDLRLATLRRNRAAAGTLRQVSPPKVKHYSPSIGLMVGGGALLLVGIGTGAAAVATQHTVEGGALTMSEYQDLVSRGQALSASAIAFDAVGGAMLASGVVLALVTRFR